MMHLLFLRLNQPSRHSSYLMSLHNDISELCWTCLSTTVSQQAPNWRQHLKYSLPFTRGNTHLSQPAVCSLAQAHTIDSDLICHWSRPQVLSYRTASLTVCNPRCSTLYKAVLKSMIFLLPSVPASQGSSGFLGLPCPDTVSPMN